MNITDHFIHRDAAILDKAPPCPFCGGTQLTVVDWCDETGEYPAVECQLCLGAAPARIWPIRAASPAPVPAEPGEPSLEYGLR